jgi:raffinose/stachyose/melibiose transport system substrate-binding protein
MKRSALAITALVAGMALAASGCTGGAPGTGPGDVQQQTTGSQQIRYMIGQPEDPADLELIESDIANFESENPGITVKLDVIPSENVRTVLQTQLRSGEGPDVFGYDTGPGFAGALAEAGLVHDLTDAYAEHDWPIYDFAQQRVTFDGEIVGVPSQMEEIGIFYNKTLFDQHGIDRPADLAELTAAAEKLEQKGVIPFAVSDKEAWQGGHLLSMALSSAVGSEGMDELLFENGSWDSPEVVDSLSIWEQWNDKGLLPPDPVAVNYDNANALFYSGKAAMNPTGSWLAMDIERNADFEVGFIPFPAPDGPGIFSGGLGSGTFVSASTAHLDASIAFLDYQLTPEHGRWAAENLQDIPAFPIDTEGMDASPLFAQVLADTAKIAEGSGDFGYNIDVLTTDTFNNAMWTGVQGILTDQAEPAEVAADLEAASKAEKE